MLIRCCLTIISIGLLTGCAAEKPSEPIAAPQDPIRSPYYPSITLEPGLHNVLVVDYERIVFDPATESTPAAVTVPVRSTAAYPINVQYEFSWFDEDGRPVHTSGWRLQNIPTGLERIFTNNAIDPDSSQWRLEIRFSR